MPVSTFSIKRRMFETFIHAATKNVIREKKMKFPNFTMTLAIFYKLLAFLGLGNEYLELFMIFYDRENHVVHK